jgi:hypothetical protein
MTFAQSQKKILTSLSTAGWQVSANLKIPHATDPSGRFRFYFKPRSIHLDIGPGFALTNARSLWCDTKAVASLDAAAIAPRLLDVAQDYSRI